MEHQDECVAQVTGQNGRLWKSMWEAGKWSCLEGYFEGFKKARQENSLCNLSGPFMRV